MPGFTCTAKCRHCAVDSSPANKTTISKEEINSVVRGFNCVRDHVSSIVFTGGGTTLFIAEINEILASILPEAPNLPISLITNGYFANTIENCELISKVKKLDNVVISHDEFHKEFISRENVTNLAEYCRQNKIECDISVVLGSPFDYGNVQYFKNLGFKCTVRAFQFLGRANLIRGSILQREHNIEWQNKCPSLDTLIFVPKRGFTWCTKNLVWNNNNLDADIFHNEAKNVLELDYFRKVRDLSFQDMKDQMDGNQNDYYTECDVCEAYLKWLKQSEI